jgi:hypothetical protein
MSEDVSLSYANGNKPIFPFLPAAWCEGGAIQEVEYVT